MSGKPGCIINTSLKSANDNEKVNYLFKPPGETGVCG